MSWESSEPIVQVLHTVGNPIRKVAIEALRKDGMRFSQLLAACDLDYDHDAGHFYYHLSELMSKRIVEKVGETYCLTKFGSKIAEMLNSLEKECSFLFVERNKGGEQKVDIQNLETEWIEPGKEFIFEKKTEKGSMKAGFYAGPGSLQKYIAEELSDGPERRKLVKFLEEFRSLKGSTLLAKDQDTPLGWAAVKCGVSWGDKPDKETGEPKIFAKTFIVIEDLAIMSWAKDRKEVALSLFKELLAKAQQTGADAVELLRVDADDSKVIEALGDLGFERIATNYTMKKTFVQ